jgi:hypothetical protein
VGCGGTAPRAAPTIPTAGPPHTIRVALEHVPWPLTARTRDERTLLRMLYPTPLRVDPRTNDVVAGLCTTWHTTDARTWTFECGSAAAAVARVVDAGTVTVRGSQVRVRLPFRWLRFPYTLTAARAAVRTLPGPFALVRARPGHVVARRGALRLDVRQMEAHHAAQLFRAGKLDEAPVAVGEIRAAQLDRTVAPSLRARQLLAVDAVLVDHIAPRDVRQVWWHTAARADYDALVPERLAPTAVSLVPGWAPPRARPRDFRVAKAKLASLPLFRLRGDAYGAELLAAAWRDLHRNGDVYRRPARLVRIAAPYPQDEAILAQLAPGAFLGAQTQHDALVRTDERLYDDATVIPIAWVVDARLVSPRLAGWRESSLGDVDYSQVRFRATSRRP